MQVRLGIAMQSTLTIWITDTPLVSPSAYPVEHGRSVYGTIVNHVCRLSSLQAPLDVSDNDTDTQLSHCTRLHSPIPAYRPAHQPYYPPPSASPKPLNIPLTSASITPHSPLAFPCLG